jgi:LemA protein
MHMAKTVSTPSKGWIIGGAIALVLVVIILWIIGSYNGLVTSREDVRAEFSNLDAAYQRRLDLIPNLVQTVAGFAEQERTVLGDVTEARSRVGSVQVNAADLEDQEKLAAYQAAQQELGGALSRLIAVAENYPQLRSSENFLALQNELEGTENRINIARRDYNTAARGYNVRVQRFPTAMIAGMFGFDQVAYFEADEGAQQAPAVTKDQFQ